MQRDIPNGLTRYRRAAPSPRRAGAEQPVGKAGRPKRRLDALFRPLNADEDAAARRPYLDLSGKYRG